MFTSFNSYEMLLRHNQQPKLRSLPIAFLVVAMGCNRSPQPGFGFQDGKPIFGQQVGPRWEGHTIVRGVNADPATFAVVPPLANATPDSWQYARDSTKVFIGAASAAYLLVDCDPATFVILTPDGKYSEDAAHVYYCGIPLKGADPKTFQILNPPYSKDSTHAYAGAASIDVLDPATFEVVKPGGSEVPFLYGGPNIELRDKTTVPTSIWGWARDSKAYYYADFRVQQADRDTFEVLNLIYAKDKDRVYCAHRRKVFPVVDADPNTFQTFPDVEARGRDRNHEFFMGKKDK